jgi:hypothetical protein
MATERLAMRDIREILRLKWTLTRSHRETARSLGISPGAVASVISRATAIGLTWDGLEGLTHDSLEARLYGPKVSGRAARPLPDPAWIHTELRRAGVTLELLHLEYLQQHPDPATTATIGPRGREAVPKRPAGRAQASPPTTTPASASMATRVAQIRRAVRP